MIIRSYILFLLLIFSIQLSASTINGRTYPKFAGKKVNLVEYNNYITYDYNVLQTTVVDKKGNFTLNHTHSKTQQAIIQIEDLVGIIYLDPLTTYSIYFPPTSEDGTYRLTRNNVNIVFDSIPNNDINGLILEFDRRIDQFYNDNFQYRRGNLLKSKIDTLKIEVKGLYENITNIYFRNYVRYTIASLDLIVVAKNQQVNRLSNYNSYIANKAVRTNNNAYMLFFTQFYDKELLTLSSNLDNEIIKTINYKGTYQSIDTLLKKDYYYRHQRVRDLILISNIFSLFNDNRFNQKNMLVILKELSEQTKSKDIKAIANDVFDKLTQMKVGSLAPDFTLMNKNNEPIKLSDFRGKYVYLNFWTTWSKASIGEMGLFPVFKEKYGKHVAFVSINMDSDKKKFDNFVAGYPNFDWNMLHFGGNSNLLDQYEVNNVPSYILIDPEGKILQYPALSPSPNGVGISIDKTFFDINKKLSKKRRWNIGGK